MSEAKMNLEKVFKAFSCFPDTLIINYRPSDINFVEDKHGITTIFSNNETETKYISYYCDMMSFVEMNREAIVTDFNVYFSDYNPGFELEITINKN